MNDADLRQEMSRAFPPERWVEYETLLDKKKTGALTSTEEQRLDTLRREADILMFRRGYAAVLLKRRGYPFALSACQWSDCQKYTHSKEENPNHANQNDYPSTSG